MKKFLLIPIFLFGFLSVHSQTVTVNKQKEKVKGEHLEVFAAELEGKKNDIEGAWVRFLKDMGKLKQMGNPMTVSEPIISGTPFTKGVVYAESKGEEKKTTVWAGINPTEWDEKDLTYVTRELQKMVYQFGIKFYRDQAQKEIDETQQALEAVEKQQQKSVNQNKDLTIKLSNNEQEKIQLEKSIDNNKLENAALKIRLENNVKAQDSLAQVNLQIRKVLEGQKEKLRKIN